MIVTLLLSVVVGAHMYIAQRLVVDLDLVPALRATLLATIYLLATSMVLQPVMQRYFQRSTGRWMAWPAFLWAGFAFYLLLGLVVTDLLWSVAGSAAVATVGQGGAGLAVARARAAIVVSVALLAAAVALRHGLRAPRLQRVTVRLRRWPRALDGFRIVQISDLHIGLLLGRTFAEQLVERCNALAADLLAVTGDAVDGSVHQLRDEVAPLARLSARHGVFFVTGNHDHYSGANAWALRMQELGMRVLRNQRVTIGAHDAAFELAGVDDLHGDMLGGQGGADVARALLGADPQRAVLLLSHDPGTFPQAAAHGVDLQISGHTHGGQIWPFTYFVRAVTPFVAGMYRRQDSQLYVSRGTGFWGPPMRLFAPAEITEITIHRAA